MAPADVQRVSHPFMKALPGCAPGSEALVAAMRTAAANNPQPAVQPAAREGERPRRLPLLCLGVAVAYGHRVGERVRLRMPRGALVVEMVQAAAEELPAMQGVPGPWQLAQLVSLHAHALSRSA